MPKQTEYDHYLWWGGELKRSTFYNMRVKYRPMTALNDIRINAAIKKFKRRNKR